MENICFGCMETMDENEKCSCGFDLDSYVSSRNELLPGTLLNNRYLIGKSLGKGELSITYIGKDTVLDMKVVVKEFFMAGINNRDHDASNEVSINSLDNISVFEKYKKQFLEQSRILGKFAKEPGIAGIQDCFEENGTGYIVVDYLPNGSLQRYMNKKKKIYWKDAVEWMIPVCDATELIHKAGFLHRDICPGHIMIDGKNLLELNDFSLAVKISEIDEKDIPSVLRSGFTPLEQYDENKPQGPWSDVYALCATLYYCITGIVPFNSIKRNVNDKIREIDKIENNCFKDVSDVILKGLSVKSSDRYQSAAELRDELKRVLKEHSDDAYGKNEETADAEEAKKDSGEQLKIHIEEKSDLRLFRKHIILKDIDLTINKNELVMIFGASGCGKSTFINAVMGYEKAKGKILLGDKDIYKDYNSVKNLIGYVPQSDLMREDDNVYNTLYNSAQMRLATSNESELKNRVEYVLDLLGIQAERNNLVKKLSGGQRKRLSIALELIGNPSLFFLDEPDSGLDGVMARNLMKKLRTIADDDKIVMVITHIPDRVADLFDKIIVLGRSQKDGYGELVFYGTMKEALIFFDVNSFEGIIHRISKIDEGGEGRTDEFVEKYKQMIKEKNHE